MPRSFCIPGIIFLFCAFVLSFIVSISLPYLTAMDIARVHFNGSPLVSGNQATMTQLRVSEIFWAYCFDESSGNTVCSNNGHGYSVTVQTSSGSSETIASSWTRGLAVHPVATGVTFVALLLSFSTHVTVTLFASIVSFLAALLTLLAFVIDIALFAWVKQQMSKLDDVSETTITGPGFWLTFVSMILLFLAGCTVCFGRRKDRMSSATTSYPMAGAKGGFWSRFRR
ncbi:hypothetical protein SERLA73DRAFT_114128 [Serpula lacrymans var. lacrymans S7.3]|uniref:Pali-domain-containing protein n=2 Tax=Serpula lacrymans var. lacrymans TaxID=341189 RepID=F8QA98_SERL3|nr:uncharacterized protein SERLADRAFT_358144 [Serpula lacrymans var. lacrymans S7.9]EGN94688.1 hypothetical protein SERLA73DRAFT_114128 [Serpula lacrymans var. lacrymans S7.3]EGO20167.1 hypothetical protein SERLADRAFT_358144 [Serpula lacrymans var. lacrymans S7.9]